MPPTTDSNPIPPADRLRVGECTVDPELREIHAPGARRPMRVTPKAMGVLQVLVAHSGRVVSRDALLAQVWPGTLPTNDVVTQAITQLRKAFADPRYIETIAKNGYRLLAPVQRLPGAPAAAVPTGAAIDSTRDATGDARVDTAAGAPVAAASVAVPGFTPAATAPAVTTPATPTTATPAPATPPPATPPPGTSADAAPAAAAGVSSAGPRPAPVPHRPRWKPAVAIAAVLAVLVAIGAAVWSLRTPPAAPAAGAGQGPVVAAAPTLNPRLITSAPGYEVAPTLSPDAAMVAYVAVPPGQAGAAILVQTTDPTPPRQLTQPPAGAEDGAPAWSPDGRSIAFRRVTRGQECRVLTVPVNGGAERVVGRCAPTDPTRFDWLPDGSGLVFAGSPGDPARPGLRVLDLNTGEWRPVDYAASVHDVDLAPRYSPDGRWIVFVRNAPLGDFWRLPATGGHLERLTGLRGDIGGWDWMPDGRAIVFSRYSDSESRLYRLDLDTRLVRDLGLEGADSPSLAAKVPALAFVKRRPYLGIHRYPLGGGEPGVRLFASSGRDVLPSIAPDGRQLVFVSDRSGQFGLWWADLQQANSLRLIDGVVPDTRHLPEWSTDGRRVLLTGTGRDGRYGLFEAIPASGRVARLELPLRDPVQASYAGAAGGLGGAAPLLVVAGDGAGRLRLSLLERRGARWQVRASIDDVSRARVDPLRQRVLFTRPTGAGLWQADLQLSPASVQVVDAAAPSVARYRTWTVADDGRLYFIDRAPGCPGWLRPGAGEGAAGYCLDPRRRAGVSGFTVSTRADAAFVALAEDEAADIGFVSLPMPAEQVWPGVGK